MSKKTIDMNLRVNRKDISNSSDNKNGKKSFEKEMETININDKISTKLLTRNFLAMGELISYAVPGILAVYEIIKNINMPGKDDDKNDKLSLTDTNAEIETMTSDVNNFSSYVNTEETVVDSSTLNIDVSEKLQQSVDSINSQVKTMVDDNKTFLANLNDGEAKLTIDSKTTISGKDPADTSSEMANVDLTAPAKGYAKAAGEAMSSVSSDIEDNIKPIYIELNDVLSETINGFNKIFSIKPADSKNVPTININGDLDEDDSYDLFDPNGEYYEIGDEEPYTILKPYVDILEKVLVRSTNTHVPMQTNVRVN